MLLIKGFAFAAFSDRALCVMAFALVHLQNWDREVKFRIPYVNI